MDSYQEIMRILNEINIPIWKKIDFYLSFVGFVFSGLAFRAANKAKEAALSAGKSVKIQTITVELSEISQKLDNLDIDISYSAARDLLNQIQRKLIRLISPFSNKKYPHIKETFSKLESEFNVAKDSLNSVRPNVQGDDIIQSNSVYYAIESSFSEINSLTANLLGLLESIAMNGGVENE